jgi:hypothetical protein
MSKEPRYLSEYKLPPGFNGKLAMPYRWLSGRPMNGHRYTDATGFRYGTKSLDPSGHANGYQLLPGYKRFLYARLPVMLIPPAGVVVATVPEHAALIGLGTGTLAAKKLHEYFGVRKFRRQVIEPVAVGVSAVIRTGHVAGQGHRWVRVPLDFRDNADAMVHVQLPLSWLAEDGDKKRLVDTVTARLNLEDMSPSWHFEAGQFWVELRVPPKPPKRVSFDQARDIQAETPDTEVLLGLGARDRPVSFSLTLDSPHLLIAGGSGAGKSELLAWLVGQLMRRGYGVAVLDAKYTSHMWLRKVPGVLYASEPEELHDALVWLDEELTRRARFVAAGGDPDTLIPLVALLEEMNGASNRLRSYWGTIKQTGDPMMSPALTALVNISSMGREMRVHILMAGQSLTSKATGGPENRENFGGRAFARATAAQWRMLAPQIKPAPVKRQQPGRWHIVVGDVVRELQAPFTSIKDHEPRLIEWATGGQPIPDVVNMMLTAEVATTARASNTTSEVVTPEGVSLRQFAENRGVPLATLRKWSQERADFPVEVATGANRTKLYDQDHLKEYCRTRLREPVTSENE